MAEAPSIRALIQRTPDDALAYLEQKGYRVTWNWWEMHGDAHARAFTVAKVASLDILTDIRKAAEKALREGQTDRWFRKTLEPILRAKGWWGKLVDVDPVTGEAQLYQAGSWRRLETIYRTNMQTAYMAGRWKQFEAQKDRAPLVQYLAVMDSRTRPSHAALHEKVFRIDDPVWNIIAPPNGFNCRCRVRNLSQRELDRRGLKAETGAQIHEREAPGKPPVDPRTGETMGEWMQRGVSIPDPARPGERVYLWADSGWDYNPGRAAGLHFVPEPVDEPPPLGPSKGPTPGPAPRARPFDANLLLPSGKDDAWYVSQFLARFDASVDRPAVFEDVTGEPLLITSELFLDRAKTAKRGGPVLKVQKNGREAYLLMLAETIMRPDEIWQSLEYHHVRQQLIVRRRYLAWWEIEGLEKQGLSVFEWSTMWWNGITTFDIGSTGSEEPDAYAERQRTGKLVYKRG